MFRSIARRLKCAYAAPKFCAFKQNDKQLYTGYVVGFYSRLTGRPIDAMERDFKEPIKTLGYAIVARIIDLNEWKRGK